MSNADIKRFANELQTVFGQIEDAKLQVKAILEAAKVQGISPKLIQKVAKEMLKDSDKLRKQFDEEEQLDMFRAQSGLFRMKGLDTTEKASAAFRAVGEQDLEKAAKDFDAFAGSNIAGNYQQDKAAIRRMQARDAAKKEAAE